MLETAFRQQIANPLNINGVRLLNEYVTASLGHDYSPTNWPSHRSWKVEAKSPKVFQPNSRPRVEFDPLAYVQFCHSDLDDLMITTQSSSPWYAMGETMMYGAKSQIEKSAVAAFDADYLAPRSLEAYRALDESLAEFEITLWESFASGLYFGDSPVQPLSLPLPSSPLLRIRSELQTWLDASIDDLAILLELSPTTLINATKPGRTARPKTIRKMMVVHGLLRELQRVLGAHAALTWARTGGRRLLADGKLSDFEQYISTHIFPEPLHGGGAHSRSFGDHDAELDLIPLQPVGRPSRV
jgi:hypothetical protein